MQKDSDGIEESVTGLARVAITAAAQLAEQVKRMIETQMRRIEAGARQDAAAAGARLEFERTAAVSQVSKVHSPEWWNKADANELGQTYATAKAWEEFSPEAKSAQERMQSELKDRYGIDVDSLNADPIRVQEQLARMEAERAAAEAAQQRIAETNDRTDAIVTMAEANRLEQAAAEVAAQAKNEANPEERAALESESAGLSERSETERSESDRSYDSAERRGSRAAALEHHGVSEDTAATRMRADVSQGRPARDAVVTGKAAKARKGRSPGQGGREAQMSR